MGITIDDIIYLFVDASFQKIDVYDLDAGEVIFSGYADEIDDEIADMEISSIDGVTKDTICFNVNTEGLI